MSNGVQIRQCGLCGRLPVRGVITEDGRLFCARHTWCVECATAHLSPCDEGLNPVSDMRLARQHESRVLADLAAVGIKLPETPLSLVPDLPNGQTARCLKFRTGAVKTAAIEVTLGLGRTRFGHCIAHEHTHALIHLAGETTMDPLLEEGVCEMVAMVWLSSVGAPKGVLDRMWRNPHPAYGIRMREVVTCAKQVGVPTVLAAVLQYGTLP